VTNATIELLKPFKNSVLIVRADNVKEFACPKERGKSFHVIYILLPLIALGRSSH